MFSYIYRISYIKGFAHLAFALHRLTEKKADFHWSDKCQDAFDALKKLLKEAPVLAYPIDDGEFLLDTNASGDHYG